MPTIIRFLVQAYREGADGRLRPEEPCSFHSPDDARSEAERRAKRGRRVVAVRWRGDPWLGDPGEVTPLLRIGEIPEGFLETIGLS